MFLCLHNKHYLASYYYMSRKARKEASINYTNVSIAFLALALCAVSAILPYWLVFPADYEMGWQIRYWGLMKVSGKYTSLVMTGADVTWIQMRDSLCAAASSFTVGGGANIMGVASAMGNAMMGVTCPQMCKTHVNDRCMKFNALMYVNFAVMGLLIGGCLVSLVGSAMPLIGKERKKDRMTWFAVDLLGFLMAAGGCLAFYFMYSTTFAAIRLTGWYQKESIGWCFFLACGGALLLIGPAIMQFTKLSGDKEKKEEGGAADQLLTAGASPDFVMPSSI